MKNKWIILVSVCLTISAIDATTTVCSPMGPGYGNSSMPYGAPQMQYGNPAMPYGSSQMQYGNAGYGTQPIPYNGTMPPPPGMMIQQPMPYNGTTLQQQNIINQPPIASGKCTCQKAGTSANGGVAQVPQGANVVNDNGVVKVYGSSTAVNASGQPVTKKPSVKVVYDDTDEVILVRPRTMNADQKSELESQITGLPASLDTNFNSAIAGMNNFGGQQSSVVQN